jgi:hypothetical protein
MKTMKTILQTIIACLTAGTLTAYPLIGTTGLVGNTRCHPAQGYNYTVQFDNSFGGRWSLSGHDSLNNDGTRTESFRGTVTDAALNGTFTRANFDWIADGYFLCSHAQALCSSFSITINNGKVTGWATYQP